jgi:predicted permease
MGAHLGRDRDSVERDVREAMNRVWRRAWSYIRRLFAHDRVERELDEELRAYVGLLTEEKRRSGLTGQDARRAALLEAGGVEQIKEKVRAVRAGAWLDDLLRDLRCGVRSLRRTPVFTGAALLALALGVGATAAVFSVVNAVLLRPLPYADPDRLVVLLHGGRDPVSPANYLDWRSQSSAFAGMAAAEYTTPTLGGSGQTERVQALRVTPDLFALLGVGALLGRTFIAADLLAPMEREVVLSYGLWQRRYAGDPAVVGSRILLSGEPHTVVGVMPRTFMFAPFWATASELWLSLSLADRATSRNGSSLRVFARLRPNVTLAQARSQLGVITARLEEEYPGTNRDVTVTSLTDMAVGGVRTALLVLLAAVGAVLLIACANVAHMLLARAATRRREMALRVALGAGRARLLRQLLVETLLLALTGGVLGLGLARAAVRALVALSASSVPRAETVNVDLRIVLFTLGLSLATGLIVGLAPAWRALGGGQAAVLREGERGTTEGGGRSRLRDLLMASEFAFALMLLVGAGLLIRSFAALRAIDPGFDAHHVLSFVVPVSGTAEAAPGRRMVFFQELLGRVRALPGVEAAGAINHLPLAGDIWGFPFRVEGAPSPRPGETPVATYRVVLPGYFETMRIPLERGRPINEGDVLSNTPVVVINEFLARRFWPDEDAIGKRLTLDDPENDPTWLTVAGVVKNTVRSEWALPPEEEIFLPWLQTRDYLEDERAHHAYLTYVVRTQRDPVTLVPAIRDLVRTLDASIPVADVLTMDDAVIAANARPRFTLVLLGAFAAIAVLLAAVGIFGLISYMVSRRTQEIGIRLALGAQPVAVLREVVGRTLIVAAAGGAVGIAGALILTRLMATLLYGVGARDPLTFVAVPAVLGVVSLFACWVPAWRATRIDPLVALREP